MRAVKEAEARLLEEQTTKSYVGLLGDIEFVGADGRADPRRRGAAPSGSPARRRRAAPARCASWSSWSAGPARGDGLDSDPTWPNHPAILGYVGHPGAELPLFRSATCGVDFAGDARRPRGAAAGDVVMLHGCCHNPTGANLTWTSGAS